MNSIASVASFSKSEAVATAPASAHVTGCEDPFRIYRRVGNVLALAILAVVLAEMVENLRLPTARDFISFWGAAQLALGGNAASAYDNGALHAVQAAAASFHGGEMPFLYPPALLLLVMPFGLLPYPVGMATWVLATFPLYFAAIRRLFPASGWLPAAFLPVVVVAVTGQNSFVMAALFIAGMILLPRRPLVAGLVLGCLVLKPQLALLLPVAVIAGRQWRAIAGAAISSIGVLLLGLLAFGTAATAAWLQQMPLYVSIARDGLVGWHKLASVYAAMRQAGLGADLALTIHGVIAAVAAVAVWQVWRSNAPARCKAAVLAAATMLASPYLFLYDAIILVIPLLWLAKEGGKPALVATLWLLPIVTIAQTFGLNGPVNLNPVAPIVLLAILWRQVRAPDAAAARDGEGEQALA